MFDLENQPQDVDHLAELVGEGKKFKDVNSLARGKAEADRLISEQKAQLETLQKELQARGDLSTFLEEIKTKTPPPAPVTPPVVEQPDVSEVVRKELERASAEQTTKSNLKQVTDALQAAHGKDALTFVQQKAQALGMTKEALEGLARQSPQAALALLGTPPSAPVRTAVPQGTLVPQQHLEVRDRAYYDRMRQNDPKQYNDPKTVSKMIADRTRLGSAYYG